MKSPASSPPERRRSELRARRWTEDFPKLAQRTVEVPATEVGVDGGPGRETRGQFAPGTAREPMEMDGGHDESQVGGAPTAGLLGTREALLNLAPLLIADQVGRGTFKSRLRHYHRSRTIYCEKGRWGRNVNVRAWSGRGVRGVPVGGGGIGGRVPTAKSGVARPPREEGASLHGPEKP